MIARYVSDGRPAQRYVDVNGLFGYRPWRGVTGGKWIKGPVPKKLSGKSRKRLEKKARIAARSSLHSEGDKK